MDGDQTPSHTDAAASDGGLDPTGPGQAGAAVLSYLSTAVGAAPHVIETADHWHLSFGFEQRFTEEGELIEYAVSAQLVGCPESECGAPDDGGIRAWSEWARDGNLHLPEGLELRSDEAVAAAAIQAVIPEASIKKQPEGARRKADFGVVLPDGRTADVEATMHTDAGRRQVTNARSRRAVSRLTHDWHVAVLDNRFVNDYSGDNAFSVNEVRKMVGEVLVRVESGEFGPADDKRIEAICEQELGQQWQWAVNEVLDSEPPLRVSILRKELAKDGRGDIHLEVATSVTHFSRVTAVSGLVTGVRQSIDHKIERDQWDGMAQSRWLVVVLDEGEAATQLRSVTEFDDELLDFSDITFPGIDEVWVVAFAEGKLTVLRLTGAGSRWSLHRDLYIPSRPKPD